MKSFRQAYTMIELILVIVVIGILASIAIATLSATRHDAKISVGVNNIKQAIVDIGSYCIAKNEFGTWQEMTDVPLDRKKKQKKSRYKTEGQNCIVFIQQIILIALQLRSIMVDIKKVHYVKTLVMN